MSVLGIAVLCGLGIAADAPKPKAATAAAPPSQEAMMAAWQKAATPGPEHAVLKNFEGKWTSHATMTMDPTQPPQVSDGSTEGMVIMGGRFVHVLHHSTMMGQPFEGAMLLGYDNLAKQYTSTWTDNTGTAIVLYQGQYDAAKKTLTMSAHFTDPMSGTVKATKGVTTFTSADAMTYEEFSAGPDGKTMKVLHIDFKRS
jgi:hypothetical protein